MSIEQRRFTRTPMSEETIYFSSDPGNERTHYFGTIVNISIGGIGLRSTIAHKPNEELWFEGIEGYTGARSGKVRWNKEVQGEELYDIGIQF
jgi:hypothetical protein